MNTGHPSTLPQYMDIDINKYYKYFRYQHPWTIVHLVIKFEQHVGYLPFTPTKVSKFTSSRPIWIQINSRCNIR